MKLNKTQSIVIIIIAIIIALSIYFVVKSTKEEKTYCPEVNPYAVCADVYDPVCGSDEITHINGCQACHYDGVEWYTIGECEY